MGPGSGELGDDLIVVDPGAFSTIFDGRIFRLRDVNGDGDGDDPGEARRMTARAGNAVGAITFDAQGTGYARTGGSVRRLRDLNGDGALHADDLCPGTAAGAVAEPSRGSAAEVPAYASSLLR